MVIKLSGVILTKNEEKNIERTLQSIGFCDEIIVIDDYSSDDTLNKILNIKNQSDKSKIKIYQRHLDSDFASQRNYGLEKATGDWVLFIDGDEVVNKELRSEISRFQSDPSSRKNTKTRDEMQKITAFRIKRRDIWWGRELKFGEIRKIRQTGLIRLMRKNSGKWAGKVHERFQVKSQKSKVKSLKYYINHYPHPTLKEFLSEINFYSTLRAKELLQQGKKTNIMEIILYPFGKFILTYFLKLGFLDGPAGFVYAFMMSFHSFLVRAKLYTNK
jgi:glycosyltransferase involved in cell wall biosynthesis